MSAVRRAARSIRLLMSPGVRGSPQSFATTVVFQIAVGLALALYPYALRLFVDGALRRSRSELVVAVIFAAVLWVLSWSIGVLVVVLGSRLTQKTDLYLTCKIAELVNSAPTLEHFERPDDLRELDLFNQNRRMLAAAPQQITNLLSIVARVAVVVILLATVNPIFVLLPLLAFVPGFASSLAARLRQRSDDELVEKNSSRERGSSDCRRLRRQQRSCASTTSAASLALAIISSRRRRSSPRTSRAEPAWQYCRIDCPSTLCGRLRRSNRAVRRRGDSRSCDSPARS